MASQPWCTGKVGMYGGSYVGATQWLAAKAKAPSLTVTRSSSPGEVCAGAVPSLEVQSDSVSAACFHPLADAD